MFPRWTGLLGLVLITAIPASAVEATLVADAHVNAARPNANSGTLSNLNVGGGYTALLQFDLGNLPDGTVASQISRAVLRLYCNRADTPGTVSIQAINSPWGEYSVTYMNLPGLATSFGTLPVGQDGTYISVDVTSMVQGWVTTPSSNNGFALTSSVAAVQFDSKENDLTGHAPILDITVVSQGPAGPKGDAGAPGVQGIQGPKGDSGPAGVEGPQGVAGTTGPQGPAGPIGPQGQQGIKGDAGAVGSTGPEGPEGKPGLVYHGTYDPTFSYSSGDVVLWQGTSFVSLVDGNLGISPDTGAPRWGTVANQGAAGPQGQMGGQGPAGPQGPPGLTGLQGTSGPPGPTGPQGPAGATGATGPQGVPGPVGMTFRGSYSPSISYAAGDGVSFDGAGYVSLINGNLTQTPDQFPGAWGKFAAGSQGPQGVAGSQGVQGPIGPVGPQGSVGATGPQGPVGPVGPQGAEGLTGPVGSIGPVGPQGASGVAGPTGLQ